ncbi:peptidase S24/S26A/S26B/S26C [Lipomyces arxii]|uniref:peptidase S24/S26A/S26B/S26C n=1 Tax=Lipomyces arxii TaxID=56418 RepID=UPI0034CE3AB0
MTMMRRLREGVKSGQIRYGLRSTAIALSWVPVIAYIANHVAWIGVIDGSSMSPTLNPDSNGFVRDVVMMTKYNVSEYSNLNRGDIVVLRNPRDGESSVVKRIIGLEGDRIKTKYPYPKSRCIVPARHVWIEGDNIHSVDSNTYGPVSFRLINAKLAYIVFPFSRIGPI